MSGQVQFDISGLGLKGIQQRQMANLVVDKVRKLGAERNIHVPKKISISGCYIGWFAVAYQTLVLKNLIIEAGTSLRLKLK